jgi:PAS domain S-box-containing protein
MSVAWFAVGLLTSLPFLIVQQRRIADLRRSRPELPGSKDDHPCAQELIDAISCPVFYKGLDGRYLGCNSAFAEYLGRKRDEIIGRTVHDLAPRELAERYAAADAALLHRAGTQVHEAKLQGADGSAHDLEVHKATFVRPDGAIGGIVGVIVDVTERKRAGSALVQSEWRFRSLAENMPANVIRYDRQARVVYLSPAMMAEIAPEVMPAPGKTLVEVFPGDESAASHQRILERVMATGTPDELKFQIPNVRGEMRMHHIRYVPERDGEGEIIGSLGIGHDITERTRTEAYEQFRSRTLELLSGGESLQELLASIVRGVEQLNLKLSCGIVLLDRDGEDFGNGEVADASDSPDAAIGNVEAGLVAESLGPLSVTGKPVIDDDGAAYSRFASVQAPGAGAEFHGCWSVPIHSSSGWVLGHFVIRHREAYSPTEFDFSVIEESTRLAGIAIERRRAEEASRASEQKFRTLTENLPDHIARYDRTGRCIFLNRRLEELLGLDASCLLGETLRPEAFPTGYVESLAAVLKTGLPSEIDVAWQDAGKGLRYHNVRFVAELGREGEIVGALAMGRDVTERHIAQRELEIRNAALNTSNDAVFLMDDALRFVFVNETACRSLGYSREVLLTKGPCEIDPDFTPEMVRALWKSNREFSDISKFETRHRTRDGRIYPVEISGTLFNYEGREFGLSVVRDISERKRMEDALRFVAQRGWEEGGQGFFDALVRYLGQTLDVDCAMVARLDEGQGSAETVAFFAGGDVVPNMRYELAGTPFDTVMGQSYCCHPRGVQQSFPEDGLLVQMGAESYAGIPLWDSCGQPLGLIAVMNGKPLHDEAWVAQLLQVVAPRAAAELERAGSDALLRARERDFRSLAESSPDCIIRYDRAGRILYLNSRMVCELGIFAGTEAIGRLPSEIWPDGRFAKVERAIAQSMETMKDVTIEIRAPLASGEQSVSQIRVVPELDDAGAVIGAIAVGRDITALKHYQQTLIARELEFRSLAENAPDHIARYDKESRIRYVNPRLAKTLGVAASDVIGKFAKDVYPGLDVSPIARVAATGESVEVDASLPDCGAGRRHWHFRLYAERGPQGDVVGVIGIGQDITKRKRAERDLLILSSAINSATDSIFLINEQLRFVYVNDRACSALGFSRDELLKMGPADIDSDISPEELSRMFADLLARGAHLGSTVSRHHAADGRVLPIEMSLSVVEYEDEKMALVVARDMTERKLAERELLILGRAINKGSDGVFLVNEQLRFTYVNDRACRALGYSRDEILNMGPADFDTDIPTENWERIRANLLADSRPVRFETGARAADGRAMALEVTASLVEHDNEQMVLVVTRDITLRKSMEDALRRREEEFRSLAENLPDIVVRYDLQCRHVYVNPAFMREVETPEDKVLGAAPDARHWRSSSLGLDEFKARLRQVTITGEPAELVFDWTRSSDSLTACYAMDMVAERGADGRVIGALCIGRDVTKLVESERRLEESRRQLRDLAARREDAREEERRHIAREIHDELGQQLSALRFKLTLLAYEFGPAQPELGKAIDNLAGLVSKAIQTTRQVSSALRPAVLDMGIVPALEWLVEEYRPYGGVSFQFRGSPGDGRLDGVRTIALFRIVQESLTNAVRHSKADRIEVVFSREADAYVVEVRDNGVGFDPKAPRDRRSVGLVGMRERTLAVGGELVLVSSMGRGTVLQVRIPAMAEKE